MNIKVSLTREGEKGRVDYQNLFIEKLEELNCYAMWRIIDCYTIGINARLSNIESFIRLGLIAMVCMDSIVPTMGDIDSVLKLKLSLKTSSWEKAFNKIKNIDKITWEIEE